MCMMRVCVCVSLCVMRVCDECVCVCVCHEGEGTWVGVSKISILDDGVTEVG